MTLWAVLPPAFAGYAGAPKEARAQLGPWGLGGLGFRVQCKLWGFGGEFLGAVQSLGAGFRVWLWGLRPFKGFWSRIERLRSRGFGSVLIGTSQFRLSLLSVLSGAKLYVNVRLCELKRPLSGKHPERTDLLMMLRPLSSSRTQLWHCLALFVFCPYLAVSVCRSFCPSSSLNLPCMHRPHI